VQRQWSKANHRLQSDRSPRVTAWQHTGGPYTISEIIFLDREKISFARSLCSSGILLSGLLEACVEPTLGRGQVSRLSNAIPDPSFGIRAHLRFSMSRYGWGHMPPCDRVADASRLRQHRVPFVFEGLEANHQHHFSTAFFFVQFCPTTGPFSTRNRLAINFCVISYYFVRFAKLLAIWRS
jgi:hypothetical protein